MTAIYHALEDLVIPTQEGSRLNAVMLFDINLSFPLFVLIQKVDQKKSRQTRMAPPVLLASAQQHSNTLIIANQLTLILVSLGVKRCLANDNANAAIVRDDRRWKTPSVSKWFSLSPFHFSY